MFDDCRSQIHAKEKNESMDTSSQTVHHFSALVRDKAAFGKPWCIYLEQEVAKAFITDVFFNPTV